MTEIKVSIVFFRDRGCYMARWLDPVTGKYKHESTGEDDEQKAGTYAAKLEERLNLGVHKPTKSISWQGFREQLTAEYLPSLAEKTQQKAEYVLNGFEKVITLRSLASINAQHLSRYQTHLRNLGRSEATIKGNLAYIMSALNWARSQEMLKEVPPVNFPRRAKKSKVMKGRPITGEEFDRMLGAVAGEAGEEEAESVKFLLNGLWWGGLRLGEALRLTWSFSGFCLVKRKTRKHERYFFRIEADSEKGNQDRFLPVAPEFEKLLPEDPPLRGLVFQPRFKGMRVYPAPLESISKLISAIGQEAGVITDTKRVKNKKGKLEEKTVYASAHDLRRGFGTRWAPKVQPKILMEMMRHESIETTMKYYVELEAIETSDLLWNVVDSESNKSGNSAQESESTDQADSQETPENKGVKESRRGESNS